MTSRNPNIDKLCLKSLIFTLIFNEYYIREAEAISMCGMLVIALIYGLVFKRFDERLLIPNGEPVHLIFHRTHSPSFG